MKSIFLGKYVAAAGQQLGSDSHYPIENINIRLCPIRCESAITGHDAVGDWLSRR
jgi:hypothetical protein